MEPSLSQIEEKSTKYNHFIDRKLQLMNETGIPLPRDKKTGVIEAMDSLDRQRIELVNMSHGSAYSTLDTGAHKIPFQYKVQDIDN